MLGGDGYEGEAGSTRSVSWGGASKLEGEAREVGDDRRVNEEGGPEGSPRAESATDRLYRRAKAATENESLQEAVQLYRELLTIDPKHLRAHNNLGVLYDRMGDYRGALAEYEAAEALDPDDVRLQCNIAAVLASLTRYREAEAKLTRALQADPQNADARENLGLVYFKRGLYAEAAEELRRAAKLDPDRASAFLYLGDALNHMDEIEAAIEALKKSVELRPNPRAYYTLGILYDRRRQSDLAEIMYRRAKELGGW